MLNVDDAALTVSPHHQVIPTNSYDKQVVLIGLKEASNFNFCSLLVCDWKRS